jgi:hypothetical protein
VLAFNVEDAIRFVCPKLDARYNNLTGKGVAWDRTLDNFYYFEEA